MNFLVCMLPPFIHLAALPLGHLELPCNSLVLLLGFVLGVQGINTALFQLNRLGGVASAYDAQTVLCKQSGGRIAKMQREGRLLPSIICWMVLPETRVEALGGRGAPGTVDDSASARTFHPARRYMKRAWTMMTELEVRPADYAL